MSRLEESSSKKINQLLGTQTLSGYYIRRQPQLILGIHQVSPVFLRVSVDLTAGLADDARES